VAAETLKKNSGGARYFGVGTINYNKRDGEGAARAYVFFFSFKRKMRRDEKSPAQNCFIYSVQSLKYLINVIIPHLFLTSIL